MTGDTVESLEVLVVSLPVDVGLPVVARDAVELEAFELPVVEAVGDV